MTIIKEIAINFVDNVFTTILGHECVICHETQQDHKILYYKKKFDDLQHFVTHKWMSDHEFRMQYRTYQNKKIIQRHIQSKNFYSNDNHFYKAEGRAFFKFVVRKPGNKSLLDKMVRCYKYCNQSILINSNKFEQLPCSHTFHKHCIKQWKNHGKNTCPVCRKEFYKINTYKPHSNMQLIVDITLNIMRTMDSRMWESNGITVIEM